MMNIDVEHGTIEKVLPDFEVKKISFRFGFPKIARKFLNAKIQNVLQQPIFTMKFPTKWGTVTSDENEHSPYCWF